MASNHDLNTCESSSKSSKSSFAFSYNRTWKFPCTRSMCSYTLQSWVRLTFTRFEDFVNLHQWKVLILFLILSLFCFGLNATTVESNFEALWVEASDRLTAEWRYLASALQRASSYSLYGGDYHQYILRRARSPQMASGGEMPSFSSGLSTKFSSSSRTVTSPFGREFLGTTETILQASSATGVAVTQNEGSPHHPGSDDPLAVYQLLTSKALLDHVEFLLKVGRLQVTVGSKKWSLKDLCQRASLPFRAESHFIQGYLDKLVPCLVATPLDCFWEGAKVLEPEEAIWVPWFGERRLLHWTNIDPIKFLEELQLRYSGGSTPEVASLMHLFRLAGVNHGYLNRTCLDPTDPACPASAPNYRGQQPEIGRILTGGCPGFASNMLHWPEEVIVGGRVYRRPAVNSSSLDDAGNGSTAVPTEGAYLARASALQSLIMLRSSWDLYDAVRLSDPYRHEPWTVEDASHVLDEWRRSLRRLIMEHNSGMPTESTWQFCAFTDTSVRDLLRDVTLRLDPVKIVGCLLLVCLYGVVCLLDWRDPVRSQCWLALTSLLISSLALLAGLGICALIRLPFNVLTTQILPFLLVGLNVDGLFTLTTCHDCCAGRVNTSSITRDYVCAENPQVSARHHISSRHYCWSPMVHSGCHCTAANGDTNAACLRHQSIPGVTATIGSCRLADCHHRQPTCLPSVLAVHAPSLLFGSFILMAAFLTSASLLLVPLVRQFCLQAAILMLVQSASLFVLLPVLIRLDSIRHTQRRLDVFCCLQNLSVRPATPETVPYLASDSSRPPSTPPVTGNNPTDEHDYCYYSSVASGAAGSGATEISRPVGAKSADGSKRMSTIVTLEADSKARVEVSLGGPFGEEQHRNCWEVFPTTKESITVSSTSTTVASQWTRSGGSSQRRTAESGRDAIRSLSAGSDWPLLVQLARRLGLALTSHWLVMSLVCSLGFSLYLLTGCLVYSGQLKLGIDWAAVTPVDSVEHKFIRVSEQAFGMYTFQLVVQGSDSEDAGGSDGDTGAVDGFRGEPGRRMLRMMMLRNVVNSGGGGGVHTADGGSHRVGMPTARTSGGGTDLPMRQRQLHQLYTRIASLPGVRVGMAAAAGGAGDRRHRANWLSVMRDWLETVQQAFDADRRLGHITDTGHWNANASRIGVLGLWLLVQTDRGPELDRIKTGRLVRGGIIDPPAFYSLLRVWRAEDSLNYTSLSCLLHPEPTVYRLGLLAGTSGHPSHLPVVPPARPLEFIHTSFYMVGVGDTERLLDLVKRVRRLTDSATSQGVASFPTGLPFNFAENYFTLTRRTAIALGILFAGILLVSLLLFASLLTALLVVVVGAGGGLCAAVCGLRLLGLNVNPISACLLLLSTAFGARLAGMLLANWPDWHSAYLLPQRSSSSSGRREPRLTDCCRLLAVSRRRRQLTRVLTNQFTALMHTSIGLLLALALLAASRVRFLADYFFYLIAFVSLVCLFNTTCFLPTLCYLIQPLHQRPRTTTDRGHRVSTTTNSRSSSVEAVAIHRHARNSYSRPVGRARCTRQPPCYCTCRSADGNVLFSGYHEPPADRSCASGSLLPPQPLLRTDSGQQPLARVHHDVDSDNNADHNEKEEGVPLVTTASSTSAAATAAAAAVAMVAAAAAAAAAVVTGDGDGGGSFSSSRSRPPSLSTIPEEPSHSGSTVSLNQSTPAGPGEADGAIAGGGLARPATTTGSTGKSVVGLLSDYCRGDQQPAALMAVADSLRWGASTRALYQQFCGSILSHMQAGSTSAGPREPVWCAGLSCFEPAQSPFDPTGTTDRPPPYREVFSSHFVPKSTHHPLTSGSCSPTPMTTSIPSHRPQLVQHRDIRDDIPDQRAVGSSGSRLELLPACRSRRRGTHSLVPSGVLITSTTTTDLPNTTTSQWHRHRHRCRHHYRRCPSTSATTSTTTSTGSRQQPNPR